MPLYRNNCFAIQESNGRKFQNSGDDASHACVFHDLEAFVGARDFEWKYQLKFGISIYMYKSYIKFIKLIFY